MRVVWLLVVCCVVLVPLALASTVFLALEAQPRIQRPAVFTPEHVERAKHILAKYDPRKMPHGTLRTIVIHQADIDLAVHYLAHRYGNGAAQVELNSGVLSLQASTRIPRLGRYINVEAVLAETATLPHFLRLRIGRLPIPAWGAAWLCAWALAQFNAQAPYALTGEMIKHVRMAEGKLTVIYRWQADFPEKLRAAVLPYDEHTRLRAYYEKLGDVVRTWSTKRVSFSEVLPALFALGQERARSGDPVVENRAALLVLTFYVNGHGLAALVPTAQGWPKLPAHTLTLNGREDFTQHFTISATLAALAGGPLADAVGLYKEVDDARFGSGFSFNDIAADRAGTRFGELAAGSKSSAAWLQQRLSAGIRELDFMPVTDDLPEFMPEAEFLRRFGGVGAPAYQQIMARIERRIAALALYRGL